MEGQKEAFSLDEDTSYHLTLHRFASVFQPPHVELSEEIRSYYSDQELIQLCLALHDPTSDAYVQERDDFVWDSEVILIHTLFMDWPTRFFAFLDLLYRSVR